MGAIFRNACASTRVSNTGMVQAAPFEAGGAIVLEAPGKQGCRKLVGAGALSAIPAKPAPKERVTFHRPKELDPTVRVGCRAWVISRGSCSYHSQMLQVHTGGRTHPGTVRFTGYLRSTSDSKRL